MEHPHFDKEKEARAWIVEDAIREATEPFLPILTDVGIADLRDVLEDAAASHPILRVFATRAAKALLPHVEAAPLREAARRRGKDDLDDFGVPKAPPPKIRDAALSGMPDLSKPEFYDPTIAVIKTLAARVAEKSRAPVKGPFRDELVQEGWRCTCEVCSKWEVFANEAGVPTVYYGPAHETAHSDYERVSAQRSRYAQNVCTAAVDFCGAARSE